MPGISVEGEVSYLAANPETVEILEQCVINWLDQISAAIESQLKKTPQVAHAVLPKGRCSSCSPPREGVRSPGLCAVRLASFLTVL